MRSTLDGVIAGPLRHPRNLEQSIPGSIHEDSTARKLGLRGGTVAGSLHMEQFPPLLVEALGEEWWRTGGLSLYFKYATTDGEGVQCYGRRPLNGQAGEQVPVWMDMEDGRRVAEGNRVDRLYRGRDAPRATDREHAAAHRPPHLRVPRHRP